VLPTGVVIAMMAYLSFQLDILDVDRIRLDEVNARLTLLGVVLDF
jgi:hypothetical protein